MDNKSFSESRFNMWRCVAGLAHADEQVTEEERVFILSKIKKMSIEEDKKDVLRKDLESGNDINALFSSITEPASRTELIYFSRLLFWSDGEFALQEEKILEKIREDVLGKIDLEKIMHDVDDRVSGIMADYDKEHEGRSNIKGHWFFELIESLLS